MISILGYGARSKHQSMYVEDQGKNDFVLSSSPDLLIGTAVSSLVCLSGWVFLVSILFVSLVKSYQTLILTILSTLITSGWSFSIHIKTSRICFEISWMYGEKVLLSLNSHLKLRCLVISCFKLAWPLQIEMPSYILFLGDGHYVRCSPMPINIVSYNLSL